MGWLGITCLGCFVLGLLCLIMANDTADENYRYVIKRECDVCARINPCASMKSILPSAVCYNYSITILHFFFHYHIMTLLQMHHDHSFSIAKPNVKFNFFISCRRFRYDSHYHYDLITLKCQLVLVLQLLLASATIIINNAYDPKLRKTN